MMNKKYIIILVSGLFIIVAGILYSCSYKEKKGQEILLSSRESGSMQSDNSDISRQAGISKLNTSKSDASQKDTQEDSQIEPQVYVHLCGAVVTPDVYEIEAGTRLKDLIELAGGLSEDAAGDYINQASVVEDGQRIYIPTKDELKDMSVSDYVLGEEGGNNQSNAKVNINTADETEFMRLTGIGEAKAKSIVEYRKKNGDFKEIKDLMKVPGIKEGLFTQLEDEITLGKGH